MCSQVDDMIDTAGTLTAAANELRVMGAKRIFAFATHGLFSGPAHQRIANSVLEKVVVCNSIPLATAQPTTPAAGAKGAAAPADAVAEVDQHKIVQVSIAGLLADAIRRIHLKKSVSALFSHQEGQTVQIVKSKDSSSKDSGSNSSPSAPTTPQPTQTPGGSNQ